MRHLLFTFALLATLAASADALSCKFAWVNPTTNTSGTPLTNLAATRIYLQAEGESVGSVIVSAAAPLQAAAVSGACKKGQYWATAVNSYGVESERSNIVAVEQPNNPVGLGAAK